MQNYTFWITTPEELPFLITKREISLELRAIGMKVKFGTILLQNRLQEQELTEGKENKSILLNR